ncbi:iron complex transport system ATP-binding protein [Streptomyces zhaozhouensis]|uniref:Iron complex transport system ATP-binding protein n=1 Tax=Streptomyces zhaozhouensis TaxID=1300267 RepID=A0A286DJP2_9ACTN|nr:heme ABC transporter ATP-binding protein [Streptomyces zhaozhouensis]SOD58975.1 iron complex transport system ATP-binding protein [Streptomyces zhaozhouensis]
MIGFRTRAAEPPSAPAAGAELAEAAGLAVRLGGRPVLTGIDLTVRAGEVLTLVGPNGAGKSTLLAALAADVAPAEGRLLVDGRPAADWTARELAFRRAVLPQAATVSFPFTVAEVVAMGRAPWAGTAAEDEDDVRVAEAMAATEVAGFADRPFGALSGGERARVALARVLAQRTGLLLLDEPTAALDLRHQEQVMRICRELAEAGRGVVVVLHDLGLAAAWADRAAVLRGGRLAAVGAPEEVFTEGLLGEVYGHPVRVLADPETGAPLIVPRRPRRGEAAGADG